MKRQRLSDTTPDVVTCRPDRSSNATGSERNHPATRDAQEAARQYDDFETGQGSPNAALYKAGRGSQLEGGELADAALVEAKRQEQLAAVQTDAAENAEQLQIDVDAIAAYGDIGSDRQVVAEMLNLDLDRLPKYAIEKIGNRQYQVVDELGESVDGNTYSTLKGARKGADVATKAQRKEYIAKARAMADRAKISRSSPGLVLSSLNRH